MHTRQSFSTLLNLGYCDLNRLFILYKAQLRFILQDSTLGENTKQHQERSFPLTQNNYFVSSYLLVYNQISWTYPRLLGVHKFIYMPAQTL